MNVGFLGLGAMGTPMAKRLCGVPSAVFSLSVYNRNAARARAFAPLGATVASTAQECVQNPDVVIAMLSHAAALEELLAGVTLKSDAILVDMSTSGRRAALSFARRVGAFVDAR